MTDTRCDSSTDSSLMWLRSSSGHRPHHVADGVAATRLCVKADRFEQARGDIEDLIQRAQADGIELA